MRGCRSGGLELDGSVRYSTVQVLLERSGRGGRWWTTCYYWEWEGLIRDLTWGVWRSGMEINLIVSTVNLIEVWSRAIVNLDFCLDG